MEVVAILLIWTVGFAVVLFGLTIKQGPGSSRNPNPPDGPAPDMRKP